MAKNKAMKKTRTRPGKARANGKKAPRRRLQKSKNGTGRALLNGSIPRAYMAFESKNQDSIVVRGTEIVAEVRCSGTPEKQEFVLNPTFSDLFPRLSTLSLSFQRWRLRRVRLCYSTACPATQSGEVSLVVLTDPQDQVPMSAQKLGANDYCVVGTCSESLCTPWWENKDPELLYLSPQASNADSNPMQHQSLKTLGAKVGFLTFHARSADVGAFAGYLSIDYDIELITPQPAAQRCLNVQSLPYQAINDATAVGTSQVVPLLEVAEAPQGQSVGCWPTDQLQSVFGAEWTSQVWEDSKGWNLPDLPRPILYDVSPGTYDMRLVYDIGSEVAYPAPISELKDYNYVVLSDSKALSKVRTSTGIEATRVVYYDPETIVDPQSDWLPMPPSVLRGSSPQQIRAQMKAYLTSEGIPQKPETAGDFIMDVFTFDSVTGTLVTIFSTTVSAGTSPGIWQTALAFTLGLIKSVIVSGVPFTANKQRTVNSVTPAITNRNSA